ncbi:hypothetical protein Cgig2_027241 [Carnegiea gigantea]|uniref:Uncharacterized protein n=1 Tax=Carnegiea gigantea TaxID=171969 RepID=A0A9Q1K264_9CARY|nr:hypothetical protein Cgig2_027241 [Carnegiea gigantea]
MSFTSSNSCQAESDTSTVPVVASFENKPIQLQLITLTNEPNRKSNSKTVTELIGNVCAGGDSVAVCGVGTGRRRRRVVLCRCVEVEPSAGQLWKQQLETLTELFVTRSGGGDTVAVCGAGTGWRRRRRVLCRCVEVEPSAGQIWKQQRSNGSRSWFAGQRRSCVS